MCKQRTSDSGTFWCQWNYGNETDGSKYSTVMPPLEDKKKIAWWFIKQKKWKVEGTPFERRGFYPKF